jgi:nucleotide-binding universal stress UspA family protein
MYKTIAVPVDLQHIDRLPKALRTAVDLAEHYGAKLCYVAATTETPGPLAHNPAEFQAKLDAFAAAEADKHGIRVQTKMIVCVDLTVDLDKQLRQAFEEIGADLVVMASHIPGVKEHLFSSNAGWIASHSPMSVFIVR